MANSGVEEEDFLADLPAQSDSFTGKRKNKRSVSFSDGYERSESPQGLGNSSSVTPPPAKPSAPEWYSDLEESQVGMFKQLFEMLDTDGGGSIDAEELYMVMKDLDIGVSLDEIKNTLQDLDKDGNGEIDFDEFLYCMSETDKYLDSLAEEEAGESGKPYSKRQTLFFTAITKFAMKNSIGEVERYYANKVRQAPHVISCYTAGVRLIGLNDRQLEKEIRRMQKAAKNSTSPYAKPLPFVTLKKNPKKKKAAEKRQSVSHHPEDSHHEYKRDSVDLHHPSPQIKRHSMAVHHDHSSVSSKKQTSHKKRSSMPGGQVDFHLHDNETHSDEDLLDEDFRPPDRMLNQRRGSAVMPNEEMLEILHELANSGNIVAKIPGIHLIPGIRQKIGHAEPLCSSVRKKKKYQQDTHHKHSEKKKNDKKKTKSPHGWVIPRMERRQMPLPVIGVPKTRHGKVFTIEDVQAIRAKVSKATDKYYSALKKAHVKTACEHMEHLHPGLIRSEALANAFRRVYRAYSPHKEAEVFALCPWIPGPRFSAWQPNLAIEGKPPPPLPPRPKSCPYRTRTPTPSGPRGAGQPRSHSSCGH